MNEYLSAAIRFKWRCLAYFFGTLFSTLGASLSTSTDDTTWKAWVIALILALGAAFGSIKALLDQSVEVGPPTPPNPERVN